MKRTVLAALAAALLALGLAACGSSSSGSSDTSSSGGATAGGTTGSSSSSSSAKPGEGKPPITIGDKNFTEEYILGQLYAQALEAKGYKVNLKPDIGSSEIIDKALTSGKIDMYPEYTGVILTVLEHQNKRPTSAEQAYQEAKKFEESRGFELLNKTPFFDADAIATTPQFADKYGLKTIADLKKVKHWSFGAPPENKTRYEGVVGLHKAYGLHNFTFVPLQIGVQYQALDQGKVDTVTVFTTDGQLLNKSKYRILTDTKNIFGFQNVAPVVNKKVLAKEGPAFAQTLNQVSALLTTRAIQQMNAAVAIQKHDPKDVASAFLRANGLK